MDYKKYSLENLSNWLYDAMSAGEATPQEIYDVIIEVVKDNYYTYKKQASEAYELLALLNGNGQSYEDVIKEKEYYEPSMPPWGHSDMEYLANPALTEDRISNFPGEQYSEEELNAMCDKTASSNEKEKCREYNLREAEYYNKRAEIDAKMDKKWKPVSTEGAPVYVSEDGDVFVHDYYNTKEDKIVKWQLPVQVDGLTGDCFVEFPDDLLERAKLKEGDVVNWVDNKDGSYTLTKVTETIKMDEC